MIVSNIPWIHNINKNLQNIIDPSSKKRENGINYNLFKICSNVETTIYLFEGEMKKSCSLNLTLFKVLHFSENSLVQLPTVLLPLLPSCDIKTNELFTGFGFSERYQKITTSNLYKTRSEQKCENIYLDNVKFISVTKLKRANYKTTHEFYLELRKLDVNTITRKTKYITTTIISFKL